MSVYSLHCIRFANLKCDFPSLPHPSDGLFQKNSQHGGILASKSNSIFVKTARISLGGLGFGTDARGHEKLA